VWICECASASVCLNVCFMLDIGRLCVLVNVCVCRCGFEYVNVSLCLREIGNKSACECFRERER
jgi:hypothetical protein